MLEQHRASQVRVIAVGGAQRDPQPPDVPTWRAQDGAVDASAWFASYGDARMPGARGQRLSQAAQGAMKELAFGQRWMALELADWFDTSPTGGGASCRSAKWAKPVKVSKFQAD